MDPLAALIAAKATVAQGRSPAPPSFEANHARSTAGPFTVRGATILLNDSVSNAWVRAAGSSVYLDADGTWYQVSGLPALTAGSTGSLFLTGNDRGNFLAIEADGLYYQNLYLQGGSGDDTLVTLPLAGSITANHVASHIDGGPGDDVAAVFIPAGTGFPGDIQNTLLGGPGNDRLIGGPGNNWLDGGAGDDTIIGGPGHDILLGGSGSNKIFPGSGTSLISYHAADALTHGGGQDTVLDLFTILEGRLSSGTQSWIRNSAITVEVQAVSALANPADNTDETIRSQLAARDATVESRNGRQLVSQAIEALHEAMTAGNYAGQPIAKFVANHRTELVPAIAAGEDPNYRTQDVCQDPSGSGDVGIRISDLDPDQPLSGDDISAEGLELVQAAGGDAGVALSRVIRARGGDYSEILCSEVLGVRQWLKATLGLTRDFQADELRDLDHFLQSYQTVQYFAGLNVTQYPSGGTGLSNAASGFWKLTRIMAGEVTSEALAVGYTAIKGVDQTYGTGIGKLLGYDFNDPRTSRASYHEMYVGLRGAWDAAR